MSQVESIEAPGFLWMSAGYTDLWGEVGVGQQTWFIIWKHDSRQTQLEYYY